MTVLAVAACGGQPSLDSLSTDSTSTTSVTGPESTGAGDGPLAPDDAGPGQDTGPAGSGGSGTGTGSSGGGAGGGTGGSAGQGTGGGTGGNGDGNGGGPYPDEGPLPPPDHPALQVLNGQHATLEEAIRTAQDGCDQVEQPEDPSKHYVTGAECRKQIRRYLEHVKVEAGPDQTEDGCTWRWKDDDTKSVLYYEGTGCPGQGGDNGGGDNGGGDNGGGDNGGGDNGGGDNGGGDNGGGDNGGGDNGGGENP
jgi:hypothetical protein